MVEKTETDASPFDAVAPKRDAFGQWHVRSLDWSIPVRNKRDAEMICNTIRSAYRSGKDDYRKILAGLTTPPSKNDW